MNLSEKRAKLLNTVRWGDQLEMVWPAGQSVQSAEVFRVNAPFPTVWRILTRVNSDNIAAPETSVGLIVYVGVGSSSFGYGFAIPYNTPTSFELPGQVMSAFFTTNNGVIANARLQLTAQIAPLVPWLGLEVLAHVAK